MVKSRLLHEGYVSTFDYRCDAGPSEKPYAELHESYSLSYVR
jgi:AraC family transcriptional regulator